MGRREFRVPVSGGHLGAWVEGSGPRVLLLHGGPGMSASYMHGLVAELVSGYEVAIYQQRGLPPSMKDGPFTIATHIDDTRAVLDALEWNRAYLAGHSWGGHLALHVASALPQRFLGLLAIDPAAAVGDGGMPAFEANLMARVPAAAPRLAELDRIDKIRGLKAIEGHEGLCLLWPGYFANPRGAPPPPDIDELSLAALNGGFESMAEKRPALEKALPSIRMPAVFIVGAGSPMPEVASRSTALRMPNARVEVVPGAGHYISMEAPGAIRRALDRLVQQP